MSAGSLSSIRVLDLSRVLAGPLCGQLLGDHGADVVKVEAPQGDDTRRWGTLLPEGSSSYYDSINRNKRNICLDLNTDDGRSTVRELVAQSDVLIENFKPGTMERWGLGYDELASQHPRLVYCRISGYGDDGPLGGLPAYDAALQAYSGLMSVNGEADREPLRVGTPIVDTVTGMNAFMGILLALLERATSGRGQRVESTLFDTALTLLHPHSAHWIASGDLPARTGGAHPSIAPYESFPTFRGPVFIAAANDRQFEALAEVLGAPELARSPMFSSNASRLAHVASLREALRERIWDADPDELGAELLSRGVVAAPVQDIAQALTSPHAAHRKMLTEIAGTKAVGLPIKLSRTPGAIASAPSLKNADAAAVLTELHRLRSATP